MAKRMRELLAQEFGTETVAAFRSTAFSAELAEWADIFVGFQRSHLTGVAPYVHQKPCASIGRWLPDGIDWIKDPHFDSSGALHVSALNLLNLALPKMRLEIFGDA